DVDARFSLSRAGGDAAEKDFPAQLAGKVSPHGGFVCFLLRVTPSAHLRVVRSAISLVEHGRGHRAAPVYSRRYDGVRVDGPAGSHLDRSHGQTPRRKGMG